MQVPSGNPFQYQYQLSLNGKSDTIGIWQNTSPPTSRPRTSTTTRRGPRASPSLTGLARAHGSAATSFNGGPDWFLDFAFLVTDARRERRDR